MEIKPINLPDFAPALLQWFDRNARFMPWRSNPVPYWVWVSEMMLQQTRVEAVRDYFDRFVQVLPDVAALGAAEEEQLLKLWEGLGYYNRVRNMKKAAELVMRRYDGQLPADFELLKELPGLGEYSAGAVASIAFSIPVPAVDGNVLRVLSRLIASDRDILLPQVKRDFSAAIKVMMPQDRPGDFNQALMELGAMVCLPNGVPLCDRCPVVGVCVANKRGLTGVLPVKKKPAQRRKEQYTVLVCRNEAGQIALTRRPQKGVLAGMVQFPMLPGRLTKEQLLDQACQLPLQVLHCEPGAGSMHVFTHIEWALASYQLTIASTLPEGWFWAQLQELQSRYAIPAAYWPFLP